MTCKKRNKDLIHLLSTMEFVFPVANAILYSFMGPRFQKDLLRLVFYKRLLSVDFQSYDLKRPRQLDENIKTIKRFFGRLKDKRKI